MVFPDCIQNTKSFLIYLSVLMCQLYSSVLRKFIKISSNGLATTTIVVLLLYRVAQFSLNLLNLELHRWIQTGKTIVTNI